MVLAVIILMLLISAFIVLVPTLLGIKRGTVKAGVKLVCAILGAVLAFIVCKILMGSIHSWYRDTLATNAGSDPNLAMTLEAIGENSVLIPLISGILGTFVIPFVFVILYWIFKGIVGIIGSVVLKLMKKSGLDFSYIFNVGWAIGLIQGLLSLVIFMMPIVGLCSLISPFTSFTSSTVNMGMIDGNYTFYEDAFANSYDERLPSDDSEIVFEQDGDKVISSENGMVHISGDISGVYEGNVVIKDGEVLVGLEDSDPLFGEADDDVYSIVNSFPIKVIGAIGSKSLYRSLTTFEANGSKICLLDEAEIFAACYKNLQPFFSTDIKNYSAKQAQALRLLSYQLQQSDLVMVLFSEIIPNASQNWLDGKTFLALDAPEVGKDLEPLMNEMLEIMSESDKDTIKEDMASIFEIVAIVLEHDTLKCMDDSRALMDNLSQKGYISKLLAATYANERMSSLVVEITNLGIRAVGTTLKIPENSEAVYDILMRDITDLVNTTSSMTVKEERQNKIYESLEDCFEQAGVKVTDDERAVIAYYLIDQFGARDDVSFGEAEDFFKAINEGFERVQGTASKTDPKFEFTSTDFNSLTDQIGYFYSGATSLVIKIKTENGYSYFESNGEKITVTTHSTDESGNYVSATYDIDIAEKKVSFSNLSSSEEFKCEGKTIENMLLDSTIGIDQLDNKEVLEEFERLESGIIKIVEFMNTIENSDGSKIDSSSIEKLGDALQELSSNKLLGDTSCDFIEGALKSDFVQEKVDGIDNDVVNDVMGNLRNEDGTADPNFSLGNTLASGVEAAELVTQLGKDNGEGSEPNEEVEKSLTWLIENMSESSANTIGKMITPTFIRERGLVNGDLEHISDMLKQLFMQMAKSESMSEQEYKSEAKAIQNLYDLMLKATSNGENIFGADSSINPDEVIGNYMTSKVISQTVYSHAYKNGQLKIDFLCFGSDSLEKSDKQEIVKAIESYYKKYNDGSDPMFKEKLKALAAMLCIQIDFTNKGVTYSFPETPGMNPLTESGGRYTYKVNGSLVKGWADINGKLYYFDSKGYALLGWQTISSKKYYFTVETGAYTGIVSIDETLYVFDANGVLIKTIS